MRSSPSNSGYVADAQGNVFVSARGRGWVVRPGGAQPGRFPITVIPQGCDKTGSLPVAGPDAFYLDESFVGLRIEGANSGDTFFVYVMGSDGEFIQVAPNVGGSNPLSSKVAGPNGAAVQTRAVANAPVLKTDGLNLSGLRSFNALISTADSASKITAATGRIGVWFWKNSVSRWVERTDLRQPPQGGQVDEATSDFDVGVDDGYGYIEASSMDDNTPGGVNLVVRLQGVQR